MAVVTAHLLGAESDLVTGGLLGFSPVLTAIALGTVFYRPGLRVAVYAALGTVFTVVVQAALNVALTPFAHSGADRAVRAGVVALPAAAPVARHARAPTGRVLIDARRRVSPATAGGSGVRAARCRPDGDDDRDAAPPPRCPAAKPLLYRLRPACSEPTLIAADECTNPGDDAPVPAEASGDRRERRAEQRGQQDRRIGGAPRLGQRPEEHAEP